MARQNAPPVSSILCPVDFSPHSRAALQYAGHVARETGARLTVFFVNDPLLVAAAAIKLADRTIARDSLVELQRFVRSAIGARARLRLNIEQATGDPAVEINARARRLRSDLIVIGTEGLSGLKKLFFGSTTHEVIRRASTRVLIVDRSTAKASPRGGWPGRRVLVPLDLGRRSEHDARAAVTLARTSHAAVTFVHVVPPVQPPPWYSSDAAMLDRLRTARARTRLAAIAEAIEPAADRQVLFGPPAETIAAAARRMRSDLVVMGVRGGDGLLRARPGAIAYEVVRHARVPVLVLAWRERRHRR